MKKYYIEVNENVIPKNSLHKSVINFIRVFDGKTYSDVEALKKYLTEQVNIRNEKYTTCQPLQVDRWPGNGDDIGIAIRNPNANWYVHLCLKLIKGELIIK